MRAACDAKRCAPGAVGRFGTARTGHRHRRTAAALLALATLPAAAHAQLAAAHSARWDARADGRRELVMDADGRPFTAYVTLRDSSGTLRATAAKDGDPVVHPMAAAGRGADLVLELTGRDGEVVRFVLQRRGDAVTGTVDQGEHRAGVTGREL